MAQSYSYLVNTLVDLFIKIDAKQNVIIFTECDHAQTMNYEVSDDISEHGFIEVKHHPDSTHIHLDVDDVENKLRELMPISDEIFEIGNYKVQFQDNCLDYRTL